jgi:hypothetical protein
MLFGKKVLETDAKENMPTQGHREMDTITIIACMEKNAHGEEENHKGNDGFSHMSISTH